MPPETATDEAVETLQHLGLRECEAKCFVGLTRLPSGTASQLSDVTGVPQAGVYDAIQVLESLGLVEIRHSRPQRFRAVPLDEATETLRDRYRTRIERLSETLGAIKPCETGRNKATQTVWTVNGRETVADRSEERLAEASAEVFLVVGEASLWTDGLREALDDVSEDVDLLVGTTDGPLRRRVRDRLPRATLVSGVDWLGTDDDAAVTIGRVMVIDRSSILISSLSRETGEEQAVVCDGSGNGVVVIARRLLARRSTVVT